jgi:hypothetical protein
VTAPTVLLVTLSVDELRVLLRAELDAALDTRASGPSTTALVDKRELARALAVSPATITRLVQDGAPRTFVGSSPRFDVEAFRVWLDGRGRQGTKAKPSKASIAGVRLLSRGAR